MNQPAIIVAAMRAGAQLLRPWSKPSPGLRRHAARAALLRAAPGSSPS
jgi:hypothetical protein